MGQPFLFFFEEKWFTEYAAMISVNLALVIVIELSLAYALGVRGKRNFGVMFELNCITNPIAVTLVFLMIRAWGNGLLTRLSVLPLEAIVVFVEGAIYARKLRNTESGRPVEKIETTEAGGPVEKLESTEAVEPVEESGGTKSNGPDERETISMKPFRLSLILNAVSYGVGVLLDVISALK